MEGIFADERDEVTGHKLDAVFTDKNNKRICSLSGQKAYHRPTMWGYYANGFKGVAIEVEVEPEKVHKVTYKKNIAQWVAGQPQGLSVRQILTTKLCRWWQEDEYRYICREGDHLSSDSAKIKAVHFGWPYRNIENAMSIKKHSPSLQAYTKAVTDLLDVTDEKGIPVFSAQIEGSKVVRADFGRADIEKLL
jgi:hypothetical protein